MKVENGDKVRIGKVVGACELYRVPSNDLTRSLICSRIDPPRSAVSRIEVYDDRQFNLIRTDKE